MRCEIERNRNVTTVISSKKIIDDEITVERVIDGCEKEKERERERGRRGGRGRGRGREGEVVDEE